MGYVNAIVDVFLFFKVKHIAEKIELPASQVEKKLSQMILDKKFQGILDQVRLPSVDVIFAVTSTAHICLLSPPPPL